MKTALLGLLSLFLYACGNSETGFLLEKTTSTIVERPLTSSSVIAQEELKDSARSMLLGMASEEKVVAKFSTFFKIGKGEESLIKDKIAYDNYLTQIESEATNLNNELMTIFNERIDLYLNLLNTSLAKKNINAVKIKLDSKNPRSTQEALNTLYSSVRSRASELSLREQYMIFQLTKFFIEKYRSENVENIVPRDAVAKFVETLIAIGKIKPQETFRKYQVVSDFLSDGELLSVFKPIVAKISMDKYSNYNELELFRKMSYFGISQKYTDFVENSADVKQFFKSLYFSSTQLVKNIPGKDSEAPNLFKSINMSFMSSQVYLAKIASENGMSVNEVAELQDLFVSEFYFPFLKSLETKDARYKQFLESTNFAGPVIQLEIILASFQNETKKIDFESLRAKYYDSLNDYKSIQDENIQKYMTEYNKATTGNLILAINGKFNAESAKKQTELYELNEKSKEATVFVLTERQSSQVLLLNKMIDEESEDDSAYLKSGVFKGDLLTTKKLYLHPLAVLIPEGNHLVIEAKSLSGGRIDGSFQKINTMEVLNSNELISVSTGNRPSQNNLSSSDKANKCLSRHPKECMEAGVSGGVMSYSRSVSQGTAPSKEKSGVEGLSGKSIQVNISNSTNLEPLVISSGLRGFKGRKGISSPLCNSVNEYQPYLGISYSFSCKYDGIPSECNGALSSYESSRTVYNVDAGLSGDGGVGGRGGDITITISDSKNLKYPALSLGGLGGIPGDKASCIAVGQASGLVGNVGKVGENGKISLIK